MTTRCPRDCAYCANVWKADPAYPRDGLPAAELVELTLGALRASGLAKVQVTGGEPLLRPDLMEILAGLRDGGAAVSMITDGGLVDAAVARELARLGVAPVQPTLLAARREVHDALKGGESFDLTVAAISHLRRAGVPVSVAFVCVQPNAADFRDVIELCFALGVRTVALSRFCAAGAGAGRLAELMPDRRALAACLEVADWANERLDMRVQVAISLPLCAVDTDAYPHLRFGRCAVTSETPGFTIDPSGHLRACSISSTILGSLRDEPWQALVGRAAESYFRAMRTPPAACRDCGLLARCGGGCRESAVTCFGDAQRPDPLAPGAGWSPS